MMLPTKCRVTVNVRISNEEFSYRGLQISQEVMTRPLSFQEMADILHAFHVLVEKYKEQ